MESKELRIGNLVSTQDGYFRIENGSDIDDTANYRPIPLPESILLKCGFEKSGMYWFKDKVYIYEWGILNISYHSHSIMYQDDDRVLITDIPYIHTLQNYFFALTGKELEVEL